MYPKVNLARERLLDCTLVALVTHRERGTIFYPPLVVHFVM